MASASARRSGLWQNRSFVLLFAAQIVSLLGSGATTIGLALFAYAMTESGRGSATAVVGNALTLRIAAFLLFSQPAGVLADRVNRKAILVAADLARAALLLLLPLATAVWHVYVLIFALNAVTAFFTPTFEASIPSVAGEKHIVEALSFSRVATDVEALAAPAVAGLIVALTGVKWVFWFDAGTYVLSAVLVLAAVLPAPPRTCAPRPSAGTFARELTHGTRAIWREPALRHALVLSFVEALAGAAVIVATVSYVRDVLRLGDLAVTLTMGAVGVGSALAAVALGRITGRYEVGARSAAILHARRHAWSRRALLTGGFLLGVTLVPGWWLPSVAFLVVLWIFNGAGQALIAIPSSTLLAEHTFEEERGKVYAAHFALTHACWLVTYPAVGHAAARLGAPLTFTAAGCACIVIASIASLAPRRDALHVHPPRRS